MTQRFFVDIYGKYLGSFDGDVIPDIFLNCIEVPSAPNNISDIWSGYDWTEFSSTSGRTTKITASAKMVIDGFEVVNFTSDDAISGAFCIDVGKFYVIFSSPLKDSNYIVSAFDSGMYRVYVNPDEYYEDFFIVTTTNMSGELENPTSMSLVVMEVN